MNEKVRSAAGIIAVIVLAVGTYIGYQRYTQRHHVADLVRDTAARLNASLRAEASGAPAADAEASARTVEEHVKTLHGMNTSSFTPLADAADDYLVTARELLKRALDMQRGRERVAADLEALRAHIKIDRGAASWTEQAVRLKTALDASTRDYRIAVESYTAILKSVPESEARIAQLVENVQPIDPQLIAKAGQHALDALSASDQNVKQVASLDVYRGR